MKTLYLECNMGAAGDMLMSALCELLPDPEGFITELSRILPEGVTVRRERLVRCGITGTHIAVSVRGHEEESHDAGHEHHHEHHHDHEHHHEHHHHHSSMADIMAIVNGMKLPEKVESDVLAVYELIAQAESRAHGKSVSEIHFHEVGTLDAIADITGVCLLIHRLAPEQILASPVHVGCGEVHCAHGILPVPAPATAHILQGVPIYGGEVQGELCTPTGAALLRHFVRDFGSMPPMRVTSAGYGCGMKEFTRANCVRAFLGETESSSEDIAELCCNIDDMTAEDIAFAADILREQGAPEVYTVPVNMKKGRPGTLLCCLCHEEQKQEMVRLIFRHTTTLGIRERSCRRYVLERREETVETPMGEVRVKRSSGYGVSRSKAEFDDLSRIAAENGLTLDEARTLL